MHNQPTDEIIGEADVPVETVTTEGIHKLKVRVENMKDYVGDLYLEYDYAPDEIPKGRMEEENEMEVEHMKISKEEPLGTFD